MNDTVDIFVYGTLRSGLPLNYFMEGATLLGEARTSPHYRLYAARIPFLYRGGDQSVTGEVWRVPCNDILEDIDRLESGYRRERVALKGGPVPVAYAYLAVGEPAQCEDHIPSGDYADYYRGLTHGL